MNKIQKLFNNYSQAHLKHYIHQELKVEKKSLHLASGISLLPFAEAYIGVNPVVTDIETNVFHLPTIIVKRFLEDNKIDSQKILNRMEFIGVDILSRKLHNKWDDDVFDFITFTNFFKSAFVQRQINLTGFSSSAIAYNVLTFILNKIKIGGMVTITDDIIPGNNLGLLSFAFNVSTYSKEFILIEDKLPSTDENDGAFLRVVAKKGDEI